MKILIPAEQSWWT